jgi:hypothetical protein
MKSFTKPAAFIFLTIVFASSLFAQSSVTEGVTVTAKLTRGISVANVGNGTVDFPEIVLAGSATSQSITPGSAEGVNLAITAHPDRDVSISFANASLTNNAWAGPLSAPTGSLTFVPNIEHTGTSSSYGGSPVTLTSGNAYTASNVTGNGMLYLWIGGDINIAADQAHGDYTGSLSITVAYP